MQKKLIQTLSQSAEPLSDQEDKYSALLDKIGDAQYVLMGEATHGTSEFYNARIEISKQLIIKKDFSAIAIEGDWPDTYLIHRYLQGAGEKNNWEIALEEFKRFPIWMWRNTTLPPFLKWLRNYNDYLPPELKIGFYGLDLYSLYSSMQAVIDYLSKIDPDSANRARSRYTCFEDVKEDPQTYAYFTSKGLKKSCVKETVDQLLDIQQQAFKFLQKDGLTAEDEYFYAVQNARLVKNAETYYRSLFEGRVSSWNIRDNHMAETLEILTDHLATRRKKPCKIIVWAHNSHIGDARATEMGMQGEVNLGQLVREQHEKTYLIGFSTYQGTVTAASDWGDPAECKRVLPGLASSYEDLFHQVNYPKFLLDLRNSDRFKHYLDISRLQRAIGVIYRPESERASHYFFTHLPLQFDCVIHFDKTTAVKPLDVNIEWKQKSEPVE